MPLGRQHTQLPKRRRRRITRRTFRVSPDLTTLAPFYSHVAAYGGQGNHGRFASRSVLARYIEPAHECGIGAI